MEGLKGLKGNDPGEAMREQLASRPGNHRTGAARRLVITTSHSQIPTGRSGVVWVSLHAYGLRNALRPV